MSTTSGNQRIDAFPYRHGGKSLGFDYVEYTLDGGQPQSLGDTIELDLSEEDSWDRLSLTVSVTVGRDTLDRVFPSGPSYDGALVVNTYCPTNHTRAEHVIEKGPLSPGTYENTVELDRTNLRGRVQLRPLLVRTKSLGGQPLGLTGPPYAERVGMKLANGEVGTVDVDEPMGGRSKDLPVIPKSFSKEPFEADEGNMWYVHTTDEANPKLYVNTDHGFVVPLFQDEGQHGRGRIRKLVVDMLGTQILTQFVLEAAELYVVHDEIRYPWQERMLFDLCGDLFEGRSADEVAQMLEPGTLSDTVNQVATRIQRRRAPHEALERVLDLSL